MNYYFDTFPTPFGDYSVVLDANDAVVLATFGGEKELREHSISGLLTRDAKRLAEARRQVSEFFSGKRKRFTLKLAAQGTDFQKRVWSVLEQIPFGETRSYAQVALAVGNPKATRAVGRANGANPICLIVPCHRVIGADGSLTGFALGTEMKRQLLEHEAPQRQLC